MPKRWKYGYDHTTGEGQKRLMYESRPFKSEPPAPLVEYKDGEYGHDPVLDEDGNPTGFVRMVPTGRIVEVDTRMEKQR